MKNSASPYLIFIQLIGTRSTKIFLIIFLMWNVFIKFRIIIMRYVLSLVLCIYFLPLFIIIYSYYQSIYFTSTLKDATSVVVASVICGTHLNKLRDVFATVLVPLITAYSIPKIDPANKMPIVTIILFSFIILLFITSSIFNGIIINNKEALGHYNNLDVYNDVYISFKDITDYYIKESLIYIALILGISLKK